MEWAEKLPLDGGRVPGERQGERQLAKSRCSFRMRASAWFRYVYPSPKAVCVCVCLGLVGRQATGQAVRQPMVKTKGRKAVNYVITLKKTWQLQWSAKYLNKLLS